MASNQHTADWRYIIENAYLQQTHMLLLQAVIETENLIH